MPTLSVADLEQFTRGIFLGVGATAEEADQVARSLVGANVRGHDSHGVLRTPQYVDFVRKGQYRIGVELRVEHETDVVAACDGQWGFGQVQAHRLLQLIIPRALRNGIAVGTARACGHVGRLGEYAETAAAAGLILLASANNDGSAQRVAPPGGIAPRLGTNPLCIGMPNSEGLRQAHNAGPSASSSSAADEEFPPALVLDFGTSAVAEGKVRSYHMDGNRPVPEGWLLDAEGHPTTDPSTLYATPQGSIRPMGGDQAYKGFGLALVLDLLSAGLAGGRCVRPDPGPVRGNNVVFVLLDPKAFSGMDHFLNEEATLTNYIRATPCAPGVQRITLPGDPEHAVWRLRHAHGIPIPDGHWQKLVDLANEFGVPVPDGLRA